MSRRKRAFIVGYYGMSNFGDDLFREVISAQAGRLLPEYEVRPTTWLRPSVNRRYASPTFFGSVLRLIAGVVAAVRSDVIVLGGGSVLWGLTGVRAVQWKLSRLTRTRFQALGVSIGPFPTNDDRVAVSRFLRGLDRLVVRDQASISLGKEMGLGSTLRMGGDLAALYPQTITLQSYRDPRVRLIGLALCNFPGFDVESEENMINAFASSLRATSTPGIEDRVCVISLNNHSHYGDDALSRRAVEKLSAKGVPALLVRYVDMGVRETWSLISSLDGLVAVRLHAAISAYLSSVPFALLEYHEKCAAFCDDVGQHESVRIRVNSSRKDYEESIRNLFLRRYGPTVPADAYIQRARLTYLSK